MCCLKQLGLTWTLWFPVVLPKQRLLAKLQCKLLAKGFSLGDEEIHKFLRRKRKNQRESWPTVYCFSLFPYFLFIKIQSQSITRQKKRFLNQVEFYPASFLKCQESWGGKSCCVSGGTGSLRFLEIMSLWETKVSSRTNVCFRYRTPFLHIAPER